MTRKEMFVALLVLVAGSAAGLLLANPPVSTPTITLPLYGAGVAAEPAAPPEDADALKRLEAKVDALQATLDKLLKIVEEEAAAPKPVASPKPDDGRPTPALIAAAGKCATCHHVNVATAKGGKFALFNADGTFADIRPTDRKRIVEKVTSGEMPKPPLVLSPEEKSAVVDWFSKPGK